MLRERGCEVLCGLCQACPRVRHARGRRGNECAGLQKRGEGVRWRLCTPRLLLPPPRTQCVARKRAVRLPTGWRVCARRLCTHTCARAPLVGFRLAFRRACVACRQHDLHSRVGMCTRGGTVHSHPNQPCAPAPACSIVTPVSRLARTAAVRPAHCVCMHS